MTSSECMRPDKCHSDQVCLHRVGDGNDKRLAHIPAIVYCFRMDHAVTRFAVSGMLMKRGERAGVGRTNQESG